MLEYLVISKNQKQENGKKTKNKKHWDKALKIQKIRY
jgi:hypothetical protein